MPSSVAAFLARLAAVLVLAVAAFALPQARAAGGASAYTITGVEVDVTDTDASAAKNKAIGEAQVKAWERLVSRLAVEGSAKKLAWMKPNQIGRMMSSLSIEEERTGPGRYIGKLNITFLPAKVRATFAKNGIAFTEKVAPATVVLPVWNAPDGAVLWGETPWRKVWEASGADQTVVPLILPKGDEIDAQAISAADALAGDEQKLDAIRYRYEGEAIVVAIAEPAGENAIRMRVAGDTPVGRVMIDKTYTAESGGVEAAAAIAAARLQTLMTQKWKQENPYEAPRPVSASQAMSVSVPFASTQEFSALRARLVGTPGVSGVNVASIQPGGALITLNYQTTIEQLQAALAQNRLRLSLVSGSWVLQAF
jgi:hypothetical protein